MGYTLVIYTAEADGNFLSTCLLRYFWSAVPWTLNPARGGLLA